MPKVTFVTPSGDEVVVDCAEGSTLMSSAVDNQVDGIPGDCGGVAACATCHVQVDPDWIEKVGPATEIEKGLLDLEFEVSECSRLGCQVNLTAEHEGLVVRVVGQQ